MRKAFVVRLLLVAALGALALPALAEGNVFEWNVGTLKAGKVYPSTLTAQNRCSKMQSFEITLENLPWVRLVDPATFSVPPGGQHVVKVQLDTRELQPGSYAGTVVIRCLTCKPPKCNQDRDTLNVTAVIPAPASAPPEVALATTDEVLGGLEEEPPGSAFTPETEAGLAAKGPCDIIRKQWREAADRVKAGKEDCDEKRRKALQAQDEAREARARADAAAQEADRLRGAREAADAEFQKARETHDTFVRSILKGVDGIQLGAPFEANPERVWEAGTRYHGLTVPGEGLAYRDEAGLHNLIAKLDAWADQLKIAEEKLGAKRDALEEADGALKRAEQEAEAAGEKADDKRSEADKARREYLACLGEMREAVTTANGLLEKANECLEIVRLRDAEEVQRKKAEAAALAKLELEKREAERTRERTRRLPKPPPLLDQPQELTGGLRQVRIALYTEVKARAMSDYDPQDCRYKCEKLLQSLLGEDFADMVRDLGLDVISASLSGFPAETTLQKAVIQGAEVLLGLGKGKDAGTILSERAAAIVGGSLLPQVYGDWLGSTVNTLSTGPALNALKEALDSGEIEAWEVDKTVEGHLGGGHMFSCPVHMRILYSKATGYVVAVATCSCPRCPKKTMIFRYRSDENGQPVGAVEVIE